MRRLLIITIILFGVISPFTAGLPDSVPQPESSLERKQKALEIVSGIETTDYRISFKNKLIISYINKSLNEAYWIDDAHLDPVMGWLVFKYEFMACNHMKILMADYPDNRELVNTYRTAIKLLCKADRKLARTMLKDAAAYAPPKGTPERLIYDTYNAKARMYYEKGTEYIHARECCKALLQFEYSWLQSSNVVK